MGYRGPQWASSEPQGIVAPEPYREPPVPPPRRYPVHVNPGDTEMSFGPGLVAPQYNGRPPSEGGIYMPKCHLNAHQYTKTASRSQSGPAKHAATPASR